MVFSCKGMNMNLSSCIACDSFPCTDARRECFAVPDINLNPVDISIILISESAPAEPADHYYAGGNTLFERTTGQAFRDAGADVNSMRDRVFSSKKASGR
jgi:hypothetical protein